VARTPENENIIRNENQTQANEAQTAYQDTQNLLGQYSQNMGTLERGGEVGADPYMTPAYLANQNKSTAFATSGANDAAKQTLLNQNRRSGGENTSGSLATIKDLALGKMRLGNQLQTQQKAQDFSKNLDWQKYLASSPLGAASTEGNLFGTATSGESATASDMSQYALAQQKEWYQNLQQLMQGAQAGASTALGDIPGAAGDIASNATG
jgi:hypothetical protein